MPSKVGCFGWMSAHMFHTHLEDLGIKVPSSLKVGQWPNPVSRLTHEPLKPRRIVWPSCRTSPRRIPHCGPHQTSVEVLGDKGGACLMTLDIQMPGEEVFEPQNISWGSAFKGSKHLLTRYLEDFGCLGWRFFWRNLPPHYPKRDSHGTIVRIFTYTWISLIFCR